MVHREKDLTAEAKMSIAGQEEKITADKKSTTSFLSGVATGQELIEKGAHEISNAYSDTSDKLTKKKETTSSRQDAPFAEPMSGAYMNSIYDLDNIIVAEDFGGEKHPY